MCEHLEKLDNELKDRQIKQTFRGQAWSDNCREWAYYDCVLDLNAIRLRHSFPDFVKSHANDDPHSGLESGFICGRCKDGIMGVHPTQSDSKIKVH